MYQPETKNGRDLDLFCLFRLGFVCEGDFCALFFVAMEPKAAETEKSECVKVVVRARPLSQKEIDEGHKKTVHMDLQLGQVVVDEPEKGEPKIFTFDHVYDERCAAECEHAIETHSDFRCTQLQVYQECGHPIVDSIVKGYNGTAS